MIPTIIHNKGATFSKCGTYRYELWRIWNDQLPKVLFIMLNPSTADANTDDPTIKRCIDFAYHWGFGGLYVGNLFAYRSTHPKDLLLTADAIGIKNDIYLKKMSQKSDIAVCAWGNAKLIRKIMSNKLVLKNINCPLYYIDLSKDGTPKHPLYLKRSLRLKKYGLKIT